MATVGQHDSLWTCRGCAVDIWTVGSRCVCSSRHLQGGSGGHLAVVLFSSSCETRGRSPHRHSRVHPRPILRPTSSNWHWREGRHRVQSHLHGGSSGRHHVHGQGCGVYFRVLLKQEHAHDLRRRTLSATLRTKLDNFCYVGIWITPDVAAQKSEPRRRPASRYKGWNSESGCRSGCRLCQ